MKDRDDKPIIKWAKVEEWQQIGWENKAVEDVRLGASERMRMEKDEKKRLLGKRGGENAIRMATIIAGGCFRETIIEQDIGWALAICERSINVAYEGARKFLDTFLYFPEMCQEVYDHIIGAGGFASERSLIRDLGRKDRYGHGLLNKALTQLQLEGRIKGPISRKTGGRPTTGYEIIGEEGFR